MNASSSKCAGRGAAEASRRWLVWLFVGIFCFQAAFGLHYAVSEYRKKGLNGAHNPWARGREYIIPPGKEYDFSDQQAYNRLAASLLEHGVFYNPAGQVSAWVTPGLPLVLAIIYTVFGYSFIPVLLFNALCATLAFFCLFRLSCELFGQKVAWIVLALLVCNLRIGNYVGYVYTDILFISLASLVLYLSYRILSGKNRGWSTFYWLGVVSGYGALVRPVLLPMCVLFGLVFLFYRVPVRKIALTAALGAVIFGAWLVRNYRFFGRFVISTNSELSTASVDYDAYRKMSFSDTYRLIFIPEAPQVRLAAQAAALGEKDTRYMEQTAYLATEEFAKWLSRDHNKKFYLWLCAWRFKSLLMPYAAQMSLRNKTISSVVWVLVFPAAAASVFVLWRNKFYWIIVLSALSLLVLPALYGVDVYLRYQLPAQICLTVPAGFFYHRAYQWLKAQRSRT